MEKRNLKLRRCLFLSLFLSVLVLLPASVAMTTTYFHLFPTPRHLIREWVGADGLIYQEWRTYTERVPTTRALMEKHGVGLGLLINAVEFALILLLIFLPCNIVLDLFGPRIFDDPQDEREALGLIIAVSLSPGSFIDAILNIVISPPSFVPGFTLMLILVWIVWAYMVRYYYKRFIGGGYEG